MAGAVETQRVGPDGYGARAGEFGRPEEQMDARSRHACGRVIGRQRRPALSDAAHDRREINLGAVDANAQAR
jgi:hypothetical protein